MSRSSKLAGLFYWCLPVLIFLFIGGSAFATTYYVSPSGSNSLSISPSSPGSLTYATANAAGGSTVILENGTYNGSASDGYYPAISSVTYQAQNWHGAIIENTTGGNLWTSAGLSPSITNIIAQGIVFGPSTGFDFSGGPAGGSGWEFLDCVFTENEGIEVGDNGLIQNCLFTDDYGNAFDLGGTDSSVVNSIIRRANRTNTDQDSTGNKQDGTTNLTINGLVSYDNAGPGLWFDTNNSGWLVENSTFFANHGGNNWYTLTVGSGTSTTVFTNTNGNNYGSGEDSQGVNVGALVMAITGANTGQTSSIKSVSVVETNNNPVTYTYTYTLNTAMTNTPASGDVFAVQQGSGGQEGSGGQAVGDGFITEANTTGTFNNNTVYGNTTCGYFYHASGSPSTMMYITNNLFADNDPDGILFWPDTRGFGPATITGNSFKFTLGASDAFANYLGTPDNTYPTSEGFVINDNDYEADGTNGAGSFANWYTTSEKFANGLGNTDSPNDYLQDTSTWDEDLGSNTNNVGFVGDMPAAYTWPASTDETWSDIYNPPTPANPFPHNTFALSGSEHQINDTNGSTTNTIDGVIDGLSPGANTNIPVVAHSPIVSGVCSVYDLNGRWVSLTVPSGDQTEFMTAVPSYVTCTTSNATVTYSIPITLNSTPPYNVTATYNPSGGGGYTGSMSMTDTPISSSSINYNLTSLGLNDWDAWGDAGGYARVQLESGGTAANLISNWSHLNPGGTATYGAASGYPDRNTSWSNGTPLSSESDDNSSLWCNGVTGQGWTFTAPAGTGKNTLYVLCGGSSGGANIKINGHLSDDTGHVVDQTGTQTTNGATYTYLYAFTYAAESSGKTITITLTKNDSNSGESVDLASAWLVEGVPGNPTGLTATPNGGGTVLLSWTASSGAASYNVYRATSSGGEGSTPYHTGITGTTFTDTGLTNGTTYYYEVTAVNPNGESVKSSESSATPEAASITHSIVSAGSAYNLTSLGPNGWYDWSVNGAAATDQSSTTSISSVAHYGAGGNYGTFGGWGPTLSWSNGATSPTSTTTDTGLSWQNEDSTVHNDCGYTFTVPASTTSHTLYILAGGNSSDTQLSATLNDGSGTSYTDNETLGSTPVLNYYTITFNASKNGSTMTIDVIKTGNNGATNGSVYLESAALD